MLPHSCHRADQVCSNLASDTDGVWIAWVVSAVSDDMRSVCTVCLVSGCSWSRTFSTMSGDNIPRSTSHPFYQFTQPSVAVSPCSGSPLDFFGSFSARLLQEQGPQNAAHGDQDSSPGAPPNARAGDPTDPWPAAHRPPRWLSTATRLTRPN